MPGLHRALSGKSQKNNKVMLGMGFLLLASVSFRPREGAGEIKNFKPLFEPAEVD